MSNNNILDNNPSNLSKIKPWNSEEFPVRVNSIRYNQDYTLLTLGTSKGYKIFLLETLKTCQDETDVVKNLGDINIAMAYYKSSLVFFLPTKDNKNFSDKEVIVFDDFYQTKIASFKDKNESIINFLLSKDVLFLITLSKITVVEIFTFKVIEIIENINYSFKLISYNYLDFIAYTHLDNKKMINIKHYIGENYKVISKTKKIVNSSFDYIQTLQLSPSGSLIGLVSIYGNKIHIYYSQTGKLKECIFLGSNLLTMEKLSFSRKENYIVLQRNDNRFYVYKLGKTQVENPKCVCDKYDDKKLMNTNINEEENKEDSGFIGFLRKSLKGKDIRDPHIFSKYEGKLLFIDFDKNENKNKDIIIINYQGFFTKYHFNKKKSGNISPSLSIKWI